ncbi:ATPase [Streptomyces albiaxialis]|uniref:ATPase n=1 Tax=Streptomyces albiaxialis TaxID=329523 RepID=A0ABN2X822_9ACTN
MRKTKAGASSSRLMQGAGTSGHDSTGADEWRLNPRVIAGRKGWRGPGAGYSPTLDAGAVYQATSRQVGGLYPYVLGAGLPPEGVPIGPDLLTHELVCLDPSGWIGTLVTNPGVWIQSEPGVGKSAIAKRLCLGYAAYGHMTVCPGDVKGEYTPLVTAMGGQVVRIGRGLDRLNPLDSGPLRGRLPGLAPERRDQLLAEINGRRAGLLTALLATDVGLGRKPNATERNIVNFAVQHVATRLLGGDDPVIPDVVKVLREGPKELWQRLEVDTEEAYRSLIRDVTLALENLTDGPLAGIFDGATTHPLDLDAPALSVDLSSLLTADDDVIAAGLLATWAYSYTSIDSARAIGMMDRPLVLPLDEMWQALRAGPGMVQAFDRMTRLNRAKSEVSLMITHSNRDPKSLPTEEDRAKAVGMMSRCSTVILGALSPEELDGLSEQRPLSDAEKALVSSWSSARVATIDNTPGGRGKRRNRHPGRGKYLIKLGNQPGTAARLQLTPSEEAMYETDPNKSRATEQMEGTG